MQLKLPRSCFHSGVAATPPFSCAGCCVLGVGLALSEDLLLKAGPPQPLMVSVSLVMPCHFAHPPGVECFTEVCYMSTYYAQKITLLTPTLFTAGYSPRLPHVNFLLNVISL